jgi:tetratricopeptide (TPR) repeat protein
MKTSSMPRTKSPLPASLIKRMLAEASWLVSHSQALADYGRKEQTRAELTRAAFAEEQAACLLEAAGREEEAANHRISAASCYEDLGQYARAVTLFRAALSVSLPSGYRARVKDQLRQCLARVQKELKKQQNPPS